MGYLCLILKLFTRNKCDQTIVTHYEMFAFTLHAFSDCTLTLVCFLAVNQTSSAIPKTWRKPNEMFCAGDAPHKDNEVCLLETKQLVTKQNVGIWFSCSWKYQCSGTEWVRGKEKKQCGQKLKRKIFPHVEKGGRQKRHSVVIVQKKYGKTTSAIFYHLVSLSKLFVLFLRVLPQSLVVTSSNRNK